MYLVYVDSLHVPGGGRLVVGKSDGLSDLRPVRLVLLPGVLLSDELCVAAEANLHFLRVHADQIMARRAHQRRKPTRKEASHQARPRRRRCLRRLLVSYTGKGLGTLREGLVLAFRHVAISFATSRYR